MLENITIYEIEDIVNDYDIRFKNMSDRGHILYDQGVIYLNPDYESELVNSLMHEITHHYLDNILGCNHRFSETEIDNMAIEYIENNPQTKKYLSNVVSGLEFEVCD